MRAEEPFWNIEFAVDAERRSVRMTGGFRELGEQRAHLLDKVIND